MRCLRHYFMHVSPHGLQAFYALAACCFIGCCGVQSKPAGKYLAPLFCEANISVCFAVKAQLQCRRFRSPLVCHTDSICVEVSAVAFSGECCSEMTNGHGPDRTLLVFFFFLLQMFFVNPLTWAFRAAVLNEFQSPEYDGCITEASDEAPCVTGQVRCCVCCFAAVRFGGSFGGVGVVSMVNMWHAVKS